MPQSINFGNVSLTLQQFNEIASGKYNAGEVRLDGERALAKINNHVHLTCLNKVSLLHEEVMAVKDAFVKALSQSGVGQDELDRVRQELGLAPTGADDMQLNQRSVRPLSRQQIREILDRNAAAINAKQGSGTIHTDAEIHAKYTDEYRAELAQTRMETNGALKDQRATEQNWSLQKCQTVIAGDVDFQPKSVREFLLQEAQRQKDVILNRSNGVPSRAPDASFHYVREFDGLNVEIKLGMSEARYVDRLNTLIWRLSTIPAPSEAVLSAHREFAALDTAQARSAWLNAQANSPDGGFKVRPAAVMLLHARGVQDYDTLSLANRLSDADARALLTALIRLPNNLRGAALSGNQAIAAFAHLPGARVPAAAQTYVPALSRDQLRAAARQAEDDVLAEGRETIARFAPGGAATRTALDMGYYPSEIGMLRRTAVLYQVATGCSADKAVEVALDPMSVARRLFSYGGKFIATPEQFASGIRLMNQFTTWFAATAAQVAHKREGANRLPAGASATVINADKTYFAANAVRAYEKFLFEEIAINNALPLLPDDPEEVFGMEANPATRFVGRGYSTSAAFTLVQIPPERRRLLYAVFDLLAPLDQTEQDAADNSVHDLNLEIISRVMRHYDEVAAMQAAGQLTRANFLTRIFPDIPNAVSMKNSELRSYFNILPADVLQNRVGGDQNLMFQVRDVMKNSGATLDEAINAVLTGQAMPFAPYMANVSCSLFELDGTANCAKQTMLKDLARPQMPNFMPSGQPALAEENQVYKVVFPDGSVYKSASNKEPEGEPPAENTTIAYRVWRFCGNVHPRQLSAVYFALSPEGAQPIKGGLVQRGIATSEHAPLTYTLSKNDATGAITVRYSEPEGLPVRFHWETTIAPDGSSVSTPLVVEP